MAAYEEQLKQREGEKAKLIRDKELANGADHCNHVWVLEE